MLGERMPEKTHESSFWAEPQLEERNVHVTCNVALTAISTSASPGLSGLSGLDASKR